MFIIVINLEINLNLSLNNKLNHTLTRLFCINIKTNMKNLITKILFIFLITFLSNQLIAQSISLVSESATINQTLCVNSTITEIKYLSAGGVTDVTVTGLPLGVDGTYSAGLYTINGTPTESGTFYYTITTVGGANAAVISEGTLKIDGPATASQGVESNLCLNSTASVGDLTASEGIYLWTHNGMGTLDYSTTLIPVYTPTQVDVGNAVVLMLTVTSNNTCPTSTATSTFKYNVKGVPSFSGNLYTYVGATTQLTGSPGKHQYYPWNSLNVSIATIDNNGLVTGVALGSTTIMLYDTNYCSVSQTFDVVTLITPSISGNLTICSGSTSQLTGTETPMANNPWVSSNTSVATVSSSGLVSGISAGTSSITYKNSTGGTSTVNFVVNETPSVSVNSQTICNGGSANLAATPSILGGYFLWGGNETSQNITVSPTSTSNFTLLYTLNGCSSNQGLGVVTVNPIPPVSAGTDITVCSGASITLNGTGAQTYSWSNGVTNGTSFIPTLSTTTYTLTGVSNGCTATDVVVVTVNVSPNLVINNPSPVCSPSTVDITSPAVTAGSSNGGQMTYWTDANCTTNLGSPNSIINPGPVFIKLTLGSCFNIKPVNVIINSQPSISGILSTYVSSTTQLTGSATAAVNTPWLSSNSLIATVSSSGLVTGLAAGNVVITYTNTNGCSNTVNVTVGLLNSISLTSTIGSDNQSICANSSINTITYTTSGASGVSFSGLPSGVIGNWNPNTVSLSGTPSISGVYTYIITLTGGNGLVTKSGTITVNTPPNLVITNPTVVCSPSTINITSADITLGSTGSLTYWTDANCTSSLGSPTTVSTPGTYFIKSTLGLCFNIQPVVVVINTSPILTITNPATVDAPLTIDITLPSITNGSTSLGALTYWINPDASIPLTKPAAVSMSGTYYIKSVLGNCSDTNFVTVTINKLSSPTSQLSAYVIPKGISQNGLCNGSAEVIIISGSAPYTYLFSDNSINSIAVSLCDGLKSVRIADANNDTLYVNFIISSPENLTTTTTLKDSTVIDSVYNSVLTNCIIDYSLIDSAKIVNYTILQNDSIKIDWNVYAGLSYVTVTNVYSMNIISTAGVYSFALQVYCPNKLSGNFLTAYDQLYITTMDISITGIQDLYFNEYSIFPNPFNEKLFITSNSKINYKVILTDLAGKVLMINEMIENNSIIDTHDLISGNYLLIIKSDEYVKTFKVCK